MSPPVYAPATSTPSGHAPAAIPVFPSGGPAGHRGSGSPPVVRRAVSACRTPDGAGCRSDSGGCARRASGYPFRDTVRLLRQPAVFIVAVDIVRIFRDAVIRPRRERAVRMQFRVRQPVSRRVCCIREIPLQGVHNMRIFPAHAVVLSYKEQQY